MARSTSRLLDVSESAFVDTDLLATFDALALGALEDCRTSLTMAMRFLSPALWRLSLDRAPLEGGQAFATDGAVLRYDPEQVLRRYRKEPDELVRDYLHTVLHCVLHHPFDKRHGEFDAWSLACDISVELCAMELCAARFASEGDDERREAGKRLSEMAGAGTAAAMYRVLRGGRFGEALFAQQGLSVQDIANLRQLFARDSHLLWWRPGQGGAVGDGRSSGAAAPGDSLHPAQQQQDDQSGHASASATTAGDGAGEQRNADAAKNQDATAPNPPRNPLPTAPAHEPDAPSPCDASSPDRASGDAPQDEALAAEWTRVSKQMEAELRARRTQSAGPAGALMSSIQTANAKPLDYDAFLRRFATMGEDIRESPDEFDYLFYTYGLELYGTTPLIEPLEYAEAERLREFVIALDTSASCSGRLIRTFVERTYGILRQQTSFGDTLNIHLIQCDKRVSKATKITSLRQLEDYCDSFWVYGGGGTDFRPVFAYVDEMIAAGEFQHLRGLVYFTDGFGVFPEQVPAYDVAFVFVDEQGIDVRVPPWAMKVVMTPDDIEYCQQSQ